LPPQSSTPTRSPAAYAALLSGAYKAAAGERVGVLLCGGNANLATLGPELLQETP